MLDRIKIEGFRSISSVDVSLRRRNVFIGANGAGKSNFVSALSFLHEIRQGRLALAVRQAGGADRLLHFGAKVSKAMRFELDFDGTANGYRLELDSAASDSLVPGLEKVLFRGDVIADYEESLQTPRYSTEARIAGVPGSSVQQHVRGHLDSFRVYHFHDTSREAPLKRTAKVEDNRFLRADGENLAAFLYLLQEKYPSALKRITQVVQQIAPFFAQFLLAPRELDPSTIRLEWQHRSSDRYFDVDALSDGTLRFIALATLLLQPLETTPQTIVVDEPELGLHPSALTLLAAMLNSVTADRARPNARQVIVATQSAQLVDHFEPEDILVVDLKDGATTVRRLEADPLKEWLEDYSLGQLWEKNEFGGRPVFG